MADETENPVVAEVAHEEPIVMAEEHPRWQIKFKSGQGQQVTAATADEARAWAVGHYGEDYAIESIEPVIVKV